MLWEELCTAFWPLATYLGLLAAISLFDVWSWMPGWLHAGLFWLAVAGVAYLVWRAVTRFHWPSRSAAIERLERRNSLAHRPIAALADVIADKPVDAGASSASQALWREHVRRAKARIGRPRVGWPSPELALSDPRAMRAAVLLLLVVGFAMAGPDWSRRLMSGFTPSLSFGTPAPIALDAWIAPPGYTGQATVFLHSGDIGKSAHKAESKTLRVPVGSKLVARMGGSGDRPEVLADGTAQNFRKVDDKTRELDYVLDKNQKIEIRRSGRTIGSWPVEIIPDRPPAAAFMGTPEATHGYALHIQFGAADDYGVESVKLALTKPGDDKDVLRIDMPVAKGKPSISGDHYQDLTDNPWAGQEVVGRIEARDALNQVGVSEPVTFTLPEREFTNPVAKKIIALRKHLKDHPKDRATVKAGLAQLADKPKDFHNDLTTALALGDAYWRLEHDKSDKAIDAVAEEMWKTAVHLENDDATQARNDVRKLTEQLQKALAEGASQQELNRLMNQLQAALDRYLQAMQKAGQKNGQPSTQAQQNAQGQRSITADALRKMLDQARQMSQTGARQAASQLLSQLQSILENLTNQAQGGQSAGSQAMQQAIANLDALARKQQSLMDQTFRQSNGGNQQGQQGQGEQGQQGQNGQTGKGQNGRGQNSQGQNGQGQGKAMSGLAGRQGQLLNELDRIMQGLGGKGVEMPDNLSRAGSAMGDAQSALGKSDSFSALNSQGEALQALRTGISQLVENINKRMGANQRGGQGYQQGTNGGFSTEHIKLPSDADVQKSREILDELRKRSGEWQRPREERDYINRLLDVY